MTLINTDEIYRLLKDERVTAYFIEAQTGISRMAISNYRNDVSDLKNLRIGNAIKIQKLINELKERDEWS